MEYLSSFTFLEGSSKLKQKHSDDFRVVHVNIIKMVVWLPIGFHWKSLCALECQSLMSLYRGFVRALPFLLKIVRLFHVSA
jgi:hypothetical protein